MVAFSSGWPIGLILLLVAILAATPVMRMADSPPNETKTRVDNLDGLRGFLALAVFFSHTLIYHNYLLTDRWKLTSFPLFTLLGEVGVSVFFMITGYLFWSQLLAKEGRPNWVRLYIGRVFRILPLYWIAVGFVIVGVVFHTGLRLNVSLPQLGTDLAQWSAGGLRREVPINAYPDTFVLMAGVTWTLGYEWKFYAALLPLSPFARSAGAWRWLPPLALAGLLGYLGIRVQPPATDLADCVALFLCGMSVASVSTWKLKDGLQDYLASAVVLVLLLVIFSLFNDIFSPAPIFLLALCFLLVVSGASGFGLLRTRPARRLGNVSFGIYLLQGPVLAATFLVPGLRAFALISPMSHWIVMGIDCVVLVVVAGIAHLVIERPGIALGKTVAARVSNFGAASSEPAA